MSLLEKKIIKKGQIDKKIAEQFEFSGNNEKYKVENICNSTVYTRKSKMGYLLCLYYLVSWKSYLKNKNTWKPVSAIQYLQKLVSTFYRNYPNKSIAISLLIDLAPSIVRYTILRKVKGTQKCGQNICSIQKKAKHQPITYQLALDFRIGFFLIFSFFC